MKRLLVLVFLVLSSVAWAGSTSVVVGQKAAPAETTTDYNSTTADGRVWTQLQATWTAARDAATGDYYKADDSDPAEGISGWTAIGAYACSRSFFYFDTSSLPDGATITAAVIYINASQLGYAGGGSSAVQAFAGSQSDTLAAADFDAFGAAWSSSTTWSSTGWNTITLNATGLSGVNKTGITKVCVREYTYDASNQTPTGSDGWVKIYFADSANDPYIKVTYQQ